MEPRREASQAVATVTEPGHRVIEPKEQSTRRSRQAVAKRLHGSTSQGESSPKKAKRGSKAEALARMPEVVPLGAEEQEEAEEEEEALPILRPRGLCSRGPMILAEGKPVGELAMAEEVERPEVDLAERDDVKILGVSTQPGPSLAQERRAEVQQPGSPSVLMPTSRVVEPSPTTGVLSGKAPIAETSWIQLSSLSSEEHDYYFGEEVDFDDEPTLSDTSKFSHISEEEIQGYVPAIISPIVEIATTEVFLLSSLIVASSR